MWAICNITADEMACQAMVLSLPYLLTPILVLIGIQSQPLCCAFASYDVAVSVAPIPSLPAALPPPPYGGGGQPCSHPDRADQRGAVIVRHMENVADFPSLSLMRHVAFTLSNLARLKIVPHLRTAVLRMITFAFADLIQSPDETIILDICSTLITICQLGTL